MALLIDSVGKLASGTGITAMHSNLSEGSNGVIA